ncbi:hypothetical protein E3E35_08875 [Thermococcus sp. GR7]|uniref:hypothetical protein n=1 Tax=unclassified Thermococcus TaxID=2627626 RepID=UPI0014321508|nr:MULTISPECIES: hypothetical protein [unclassified Thermococcus]NJE47506.1 hypothetical protein [Thermococcus sp. GR7]NJE78566.1 hypothetical protein [Thermococcus sp. GR4]NJF23556.1 hypothetical protein [Thermococcus sp. GR5]
MRKFMAIAAVMILLFPLIGRVGASSFTGWMSVPGVITLEDTIIELRDVSFDDGSLMVVLLNGSTSNTFIVKLGESLTFGQTRLTYFRVLANSESLVLIKVNFSHVFPGQNVTFGDYTISVLSVDSSGAKLRVSKGNESKEFTSSDFTFGDIRVKVSAYPKIFEGYLKRGQDVSAYGHILTFSNATVKNTTGGFIETVFFTYKNNTYPIEVGKEANVGVFHVKVEELVGVDYVKVVVNFIGASIDVETVPDLTFMLSPGQTQKVGPYIISYDYYFGGATVSLRNSCGEVLRSAKLSADPISALLYYGGAAVGLESIASNGTATFFAMVDETKIPSVDKVANLLISVSSDGGKQYVPMTAMVTVQNTGTVDLSNVSLKFVPEGDVEILPGEELFLQRIRPSEKKTFEVKLLSHRSGSLTLGHVEAEAVAPSELACGGYTVLNFRSNDLQVSIEPSNISYELSVEAPNQVPIYHPALIMVTVTNTGDVSVPANLTVALPQGVAVGLDDAFSSRGDIMIAPLSLLSGENVTLSLKAIPYTEGTKEFILRIETPFGIMDSTVLNLDVTVSQGNETTATVIETTAVPSNGTVTVTETYTTTETQTFETTVTNVQTVPYTPTSAKAMWGVLGFVLGALVIIALAWYQAKKV